MKNVFLTGALLSSALFSLPAHAQHEGHNHNHNHHHDHSQITTPLSMMASHLHNKGEWMVSYRYMHMNMEGNRDGTNNLSPGEISGVFANTTGTGPTTMRIVPTEMQTDMHMLGAMYGLSDKITLIAMANYISRDMEHITFAAANPAQEIGRFTTKSSGIGDTKISGLFQLYQSGSHSIIGRAGLSLPTGTITENGTIINPMGMRQRVRLPYAMQIGSGTYDLEPALTYSGAKNRLGWGAQYKAQIRLGENDQDYTLGDKHIITGWAGYKWNDTLASTLQISAEKEGQIDGRSARIAGPVQTANPDNYGGERVMAGFGLNFNPSNPNYNRHSFGAELTVPVYQDLNGPQLERDYALRLNYNLTF